MNTELKDSISRLSRLGAASAVALGLMGFLDEYHLVFELTVHFRLQYLVISVFCLLIMLVYRYRWWACLCLFSVILNSASVIPWFFSGNSGTLLNYASNAGHIQGESLKILLANVHAENRNYSALVSLAEKEMPHIVILQEVNSDWMKGITQLGNDFPYVISKPREDYFGIAMFSRIPFRKADIVFPGKAGMPAIIADMEFRGKMFSVLGVHVFPPASELLFELRNEQLDRVSDIVTGRPYPVIVAGDLNITMWSSYYKKMVTSAGLKNARQGFGILPSWPVMIPFMMIPIDHVLCSSGFDVIDIRTSEKTGSDHLPVVATFAINGS